MTVKDLTSVQAGAAETLLKVNKNGGVLKISATSG